MMNMSFENGRHHDGSVRKNFHPRPLTHRGRKSGYVRRAFPPNHAEHLLWTPCIPRQSPKNRSHSSSKAGRILPRRVPRPAKRKIAGQQELMVPVPPAIHPKRLLPACPFAPSCAAISLPVRVSTSDSSLFLFQRLAISVAIIPRLRLPEFAALLWADALRLPPDRFP